ncbi:MAG: hypothetical protein LH473_09185 [Chitinophagales bacterium]|nr:hypothetical protein [Chitinophagales bacterium]
MLKKLREQRHILLRVKVSVDEIIQQVQKIRSNYSVLAICPDVTGNNYQGVKSATLGLFPMNTLVLPQYFSKSVYSVAELKKIAQAIAGLKFETIVFSGMPRYCETLIHTLKSHKNLSAKILFIYHGSLSSNTEYGLDASDYLDWLLEITSSKQITKLAFVKKGMAELFYSLQKLNTHHLLLKTPELKPAKINFEKDELHIGVLGSGHYRKNFHNQVAAALLFSEAKVHVKKTDELNYLKSNSRIVQHKYFENHSEFLNLVGSMSLNFYVTFSECWGQLVTESLMMGVPCLAAYNSGILDFDIDLKEALVVEDFDNAVAIYNQALQVLENRKEISEKGIIYVKELNKIADDRLIQFLKA